MEDSFLVECWNYWSSGSMGKLYAILNEETRQQDTKRSEIGAVRAMDTDKDKQISREELAEYRKRKAEEK